MATRREFLHKTAVAAVTAATSVDFVQAAEGKEASGKTSRALNRSGRFPISPFQAAICRDETLLRLGGYGATGHITWSADDKQLAAVNEGGGWPGLPNDFYFGGALIAISGEPDTAKFQVAPGYPYTAIRDCHRVNPSPIYYIGRCPFGERA